MRIPLEEKTEIKVDIGRFSIDSVLSEGGGTSIAYNAHWYPVGSSQSTPVILKEFYPTEKILRGVRRREDGSVAFSSDNYKKLLDDFKRQVIINNEISTFMVDGTERISGYFDRMYCFDYNGTSYVFSEARAIGTVQQLIKQKGLPRNRQDIIERFEFTKRIIESIEPIHAKGCVHLDVKGDNLYVTDQVLNDTFGNTIVKAIDYGSCINLNSTDIRQKQAIYYSSGYIPTRVEQLLCDIADENDLVSNEWIHSNREKLISCDSFAIRSILFLLLFGKTPEKLGRKEVIYRLQFNNNEATGIDAIESSYIEQILLSDFSSTNWTLDDLTLLIELVLHLLNRDFIDESMVPCQDMYYKYNAYLLKAKSGDYYNEHESILFKTKHYPRKFVPNQNPIEVKLSADLFEVAMKERKTETEDLELYLNKISLSTPLEELLINNLAECKLYLQGLGGSGKTVALSQIYKWCLEHDEYLPLYCDLGLIDKMDGVIDSDSAGNCIIKHICKQIGFNGIDILSLRKVKKIVLLLDNYQKIGTLNSNTVANELVNCSNSISIVLSGRNELALNELPKFRRVKILGINKAELDIELPSSKIFDLPHFAMLYRDLYLSKTTEKERYGDEFARVRILFDYLFLGNKIESNSLLVKSDITLENIHAIDVVLRYMLPSLAYRSLINKEDISIVDVEKELDSKYNINKAGLFENLASKEMSIVSLEEGQITFNHDTYQEFLCAYHIAVSIKKVLDFTIPINEKTSEIRNAGGTKWVEYELRQMVSEILRANLIYNDALMTFMDMLDEQISMNAKKQQLVDMSNTEAGEWLTYNIIRTFFLTVEESIMTTYHNKECKLNELATNSIIDLDRAYNWAIISNDNHVPELYNIIGLYHWEKGDIKNAEHCFEVAGDGGFYLGYRNIGLMELYYLCQYMPDDRWGHIHKGIQYLIKGVDAFRDYKCLSYLVINLGFWRLAMSGNLQDEEIVKRVRQCKSLIITDSNYYKSLGRLLLTFSLRHSPYTEEIFEIVESNGYADGLIYYSMSKYFIANNNIDKALRCIDTSIEYADYYDWTYSGRYMEGRLLYWKGTILSHLPQRANEASDYFFRAIHSGYLSSYINIGKGYLYGDIGLKEDYVEAEKYFYKIIDLTRTSTTKNTYFDPLDYGKACYYLGILRERQALYSEALEFFLEGESGNSNDAISHLGDIFNPHTKTHEYYKNIISEGENKFVNYYKEAEKKHKEAKYNLAECYENGWGVEANIPEAIKRYKELSKAGYKKAIYKLAKYDRKEAYRCMNEIKVDASYADFEEIFDLLHFSPIY